MQEFSKKNANKKEVAMRIRQIRTDLGHSLDSFAEVLGVERANVYIWEKGVCLPNKERIRKICELAKINPNQLLHGCKVNLDNLVEIFLDLPPKKQREFLKRIIAAEKKKEQKR